VSLEGDHLVAIVHEAAKTRVTLVVAQEREADLFELVAYLERDVAGAGHLVAESLELLV
jgi:hypothetical protein